MDNNVKQLFLHFLKQEGIYESYIFNFNNTLHINKNFDRFILKTEERYFIRFAFSWESTKEGYDFWLKKSIKWVNEINK